MSRLEKQIIVGGERVDYLYNPSILSVTDTSNNAIEDVAEVAELLKNDSSGASKWVTKDIGFVDSNGEVVTGVRYGSQVTDETAGSVDADFVVATSNAGSLSESFRIKSDKTQQTKISKSSTVQRNAYTFYLTADTVGVDPVEMFIDGVENARLVVPLGSLWFFEINIIGRLKESTGYTWAQRIVGSSEHGTSPDQLYKGGSTDPVVTDFSPPVEDWGISVSNEGTATKAIEIIVNGDANQSVAWLAEVKVLEIVNG